MGRVPGGRFALAALLVLAASGCSTIGTYGWPTHTVVDVIERPAEVEVRTVPGGAVVAPEGGVAIGRAPVTYETLYTVRRTYQRRSWKGAVLGAVFSAAIATYGIVRSVEREEGVFSLEPGPVLFWGGVLDAATGFALAMTMVPQQNRRALLDARREPLPRTVALAVAWDGWPATRVEVALPLERRVTVRRPTFGSVDEALVQWARMGSREPGPAGLLRVGMALADIADRTGREADAAEAVGWLERYLASPDQPEEARAPVQARVDALRRRLPALAPPAVPAGAP